MDEKFLAESKQYNIKKLLVLFIICGTILSIIMFVAVFVTKMNGYSYKIGESYDYAKRQFEIHDEGTNCNTDSNERCKYCKFINAYPTKFSYGIAQMFGDDLNDLILCVLPIIALSIIGTIIFFGLQSYKLTVTDKRVYGKIAFGKRIDLPVDSISAIATIEFLKGISISTSSGRIKFLVIKNSNEIYKVLNNLIIKRQDTKNTVIYTSPANTPQNIDETDKIKKYKDLLDSGIISKEEFEAKKKDLLGL